MVLKSKATLSGLLLLLSTTIFAQDSVDSGGGGASGDDPNSNLTAYLENLGKYFGYDITNYCTTGGVCSSSSGSSSTFSNWLLNVQNDYSPELNLYNSFLGAILPPGGSSGSQGSAIVSSTASGVSMINSLAGQTFSNQPNGSPFSSPSGNGVAVSALIDQQTYQNDPVSQAVLNLLGTPNSSYCMKNDGTWNQNCSYLYRSLILSQVIGTLPQTDQFFSYDYNQNLLPQLNPNTLLSPMLYSAQSGNTSSTSSPVPSQNQNQGLPAATQMQQAANFIRYVSGTVTPLRLPDRKAYDDLYSKANNLTNNVDQATQLRAQTILAEYLASVRTYSAQVAVGMSNLYYLLSKRMPQNLSGGSNGDSGSSGSNNITSQALSEYTMATWRLFNPSAASGGDSAQQQQWVAQINQANSATVQKEIAILLAEINYQMYLSRQQQERLLMTESILLIQNAHAGEPVGEISMDNSSGYQNPSSSSNSSSGSN